MGKNNKIKNAETIQSDYSPLWNNFSLEFFIKGFKFSLIHLSMMWFVLPRIRPKILSLCGHKFKNPKSIFIGTDVLFDHASGVRTYIGEHVTIASGAKIMNHFLIPDGSNSNYQKGDVVIDDGVFIGMNVLIVKSVRIGRNSVIAAGSVVITDIPPNVIAGGVPAKVIKLNN